MPGTSRKALLKKATLEVASGIMPLLDQQLRGHAGLALNLLSPEAGWAVVARCWTPAHPEAPELAEALLAGPLSNARVRTLLGSHPALHTPLRACLAQQLDKPAPNAKVLRAGMTFVALAPDTVPDMPAFVEILQQAFTRAGDLSWRPPATIWQNPVWRARVNTREFLRAVAQSGALLQPHFLVKCMLDSGEIHADWLVAKPPGTRLATKLTMAALAHPDRHPAWFARLPSNLFWVQVWTAGDLRMVIPPGQAVATFRAALQGANLTPMRRLLKSPMLGKLGPALLQETAALVADARSLLFLQRAQPGVLSAEWANRVIPRRLETSSLSSRGALLKHFVLPFLARDDPASCRPLWRAAIRCCVKTDSVSFGDTYRVLGQLPGFRQQGPDATAALLWLLRKDHAELRNTAETLYGRPGKEWVTLMLAMGCETEGLSTWISLFPRTLTQEAPAPDGQLEK